MNVITRLVIILLHVCLLCAFVGMIIEVTTNTVLGLEIVMYSLMALFALVAIGIATA